MLKKILHQTIGVRLINELKYLIIKVLTSGRQLESSKILDWQSMSALVRVKNVNQPEPNFMQQFSLTITLARVVWHGLSTVGLVLAAGSAAHSAVTMNWADVGNAGNAPDTTGFGTVSSDYRIAKEEVTNAQYAEFLNV